MSSIDQSENRNNDEVTQDKIVSQSNQYDWKGKNQSQLRLDWVSKKCLTICK